MKVISHDFSKEFFDMYHAAVFEALGENAARYNARIGAILAKAWQTKLKQSTDQAELKETISEPFSFSDIARFEFNDDGTACLYVKGCDICNGNELLRSSGKKGSCPISQMVKSAMGKAPEDRSRTHGQREARPGRRVLFEIQDSQVSCTCTALA